MSSLAPASAGHVLRGLRAHLGLASPSCIALLLEVVLDGLRVSPPAVSALLRLCGAAAGPVTKWDGLLVLSLAGEPRHAAAAAAAAARAVRVGSLSPELFAECASQPSLVPLSPAAVNAMLGPLLFGRGTATPPPPPPP
eukprot:scaffold6592_cov54-Isochrysis_galbana.AAC.1